MVVFRLTDSNLERIFSLGLLLLLAARVSLVNGQPQGVSLMLSGATISNDSIVDLDDLWSRGSNPPSDANSNGALLCITDLQDCCGTPNIRGDWYFPDDSRVESSATEFRVNRGASVVRLWRRFSAIPEMGIGRFRCGIPNAANSNINIYVNILDFGARFNVDHVIFSPSTGSTTAGERDYSLSCSMILFNPVPLASDVPSPNFQWSFGDSASLPSGVTATSTVMSSSNSTSETYTSTLQFSSPLSQSVHTGMYTCQLGPGRLVNSVMITVNVPPISIQITASKAPVVGQSSYSLKCTAIGTGNLNPSMSYQWTKNNGTQTQMVGENSNFLSFSRLLASDAGLYSCNVTVLSAYVSTTVYASNTFEVTVIIPEATVSVHSDSPSPILSGSSPTLTCTVEMKSTVRIPLAVSMVWTGPDGTTVVTTTRPEMISFTLYSSSHTLDSVELADSGEYTCTVKIENEPEVHARTNITIVDGVFQLRLKSVGLCQQWYSENCERSKEYSYFIKGALVKAIEHHCKCHFPITNLLNEDLFLYDGSSSLMIYRNTLLGTLNFNGTQITGFIRDWVNTGPLIKIDGNPVRVDGSCPTAISSLDEPVCGEKEEKCLYDNDPKYAMCAQHLANNNIATCFEGCVVRNG